MNDPSTRWSLPLAMFFVLVLVSSWSPVRAQCSDGDADGFFREPGCGSAPDCNDADAATYPGALEPCDGFDRDCDGLVDDGCDTVCEAPEIGPPTNVTDWADARYSGQPALVWSGTGYGVAWTDASKFAFTRLDGAGGVLAPVQRTSTSALLPDVAWTGSQYGVAWTVRSSGRDEIYFARFGPDGARLGSEARVTDAPGYKEFVSLVWTGAEYALAWQDTRSPSGALEAYFATLDADGGTSGSEVRLTADDGVHSGSPTLAWNGNGFGLAWTESGAASGIWFRALDVSGAPVGEAVRVAPAGPHELAWTGSGYGIAWNEDRDLDGKAEVWFVSLDAEGHAFGVEVRLSDESFHAQQPSLAWTGSEFGVLWVAETDWGPLDLRFARVTEHGVPVGEPTGWSDRPIGFYEPDLVWTGTGFAAVFRENGALNQEVGFARVMCDCFDDDEDGITTCEGDCDDTDPGLGIPGEEICNGRDDDCDGQVDEDADGEDPDGDGVGNLCDNCRDTPNSTQADQDADGVGDACDDCPSVPNASQDDGDADGVGDACDDCPSTVNPAQTDLDHDGEGDACDVDDGEIHLSFAGRDRLAWDVEVGFDRWNCYRGDIDELRLSGEYTQAYGSNPLADRHCGMTDTAMDDVVTPSDGRSAFYLVTGSNAVGEGSLGEDGAGVIRPNHAPCP